MFNKQGLKTKSNRQLPRYASIDQSITAEEKQPKEMTPYGDPNVEIETPALLKYHANIDLILERKPSRPLLKSKKQR